MKLEDLYPYWPPTHDEFVDRLRYASDEQWNSNAGLPSRLSVRLLVWRFIEFERIWFQKVAQGRAPDSVSISELNDRLEYVSQMEAVRAQTTAYLESLGFEALRSVRVAPGDPQRNEIERNVPLSWIVWRLLEEELMTYGQVKLILDQSSEPRLTLRNR